MDGSNLYNLSNNVRDSMSTREKMGSLRSNSSAIWRNSGMEVFSKSARDEDDEEALKWASIENLPTFDRLRKGLLLGTEVDIHELGAEERKKLLERLVNVAEEDNEKFLLKLRDRVDRVGIDLPQIEVRFAHLKIEAEAHVGRSRALPSFMNFCIGIVEGLLNTLHIIPSKKERLTILNDLSGIIRPCRMTLLLGGFVLARDNVAKWWLWGYYSSPMMYGMNAIAVNEFLGPQWNKPVANGTETIGVAILKSRVTMALTYLDPLGKPQTVPPQKEPANVIVLSSRRGIHDEANENKKKGMILPFEPHSITFDDVKYSVDMPLEMKDQGVAEDKLLLLKGVSGSFRPGVLTALMGVSGAAWLRLPLDVDSTTRKMFVDEVLELVELNTLKTGLVGIPGVTGLSTEQRKRLTIAVELVANPSIIFMDEPTSGLDARAAAVVMRTVRNTVDTGRTVVCTIHQPSIDIFEAFDELFLMKRGGEEIYAGPVGRHSCELIKYFEDIEGASKIKDGYNPATWMLEVTASAQERVLGIDFAEVYHNSDLYRRNKALVRESSIPRPGGKQTSETRILSQELRIVVSEIIDEVSDVRN
ncbi:hypothetical protein POM88_038554 [Heracleum sosnowskyi]|uniref:ABC transporter domain-containing protein n=1 Tax=Heracleum sosnowskyi TaxID=360622 RepID=A0AAD8HAL4_9APIA|nr:hypothetical protein POM88_038554 [Heracleum sosnowskyi]